MPSRRQHQPRLFTSTVRSAFALAWFAAAAALLLLGRPARAFSTTVFRQQQVLAARRATTATAAAKGFSATTTPSTSTRQRLCVKMAAGDGSNNGGAAPGTVAVCFDFDGTLGDTETPAMEVAFWEVAPYLPGLPIDDTAALNAFKSQFIQDNAGRAFEFMVEDIDKEREGQGLPTVEEAWKVPPSEHVAGIVDVVRAKFGLKPLNQVLAAKTYPTIFIQQKEETNLALAVATEPCPGVLDVCGLLTKAGTRFCIATTSPKPRVPISVKAAGLEGYFPPDKIHSGESDFDPPRFKPAPDVYLKAAAAEGCAPIDCVAVEDSGSGVGSAANAGMGLIIGYVGGSHIPAAKKDGHAHMLMSGSKSEDGRGAELVVEDFANVATLVAAFKADTAGRAGLTPGGYKFSDAVLKGLKGRVWLPGQK